MIDVDRDGWTEQLQLNMAQINEHGHGHGYRLAGPKYNGSSSNLLRATLDERDAAEIRKYLDVVFPAPADGPAMPLFLAEFDTAEPTVHLTLASARARCDEIAGTVADGRHWDWSRDEHGAYVQFWTHEDDDRALRFTGGQVTEVRVQPVEDVVPDFFQSGRAYAHGPWVFRCDVVTLHPETGERTALGWFRFRQSEWAAQHYGEDVWAEGSWVEDADGGAS